VFVSKLSKQDVSSREGLVTTDAKHDDQLSKVKFSSTTAVTAATTTTAAAATNEVEKGFRFQHRFTANVTLRDRPTDVSHSGIEEVVAVQVHRDGSTKLYSWEHGFSDHVVKGLPSLVQPDDSLRQWCHRFVSNIRSRQTLRDQPAAKRRISLKRRCYKTVGPRWHHCRRESSGCTRDGNPFTT
jgi:hypothetical protein